MTSIHGSEPETTDHFNALKDWANGKISSKSLSRTFSIPTESTKSLIGRIKNAFTRSCPQRDTCATLMNALLSIHAEIAQMDDGPEKTDKINALKAIYEKIRSEFWDIQKDPGIKSLIMASDLLESYNTAFQTSLAPSLGLHRITSTVPNPDQAQKTERITDRPKKALASVGERAILLADYNKLGDIVNKITGAQETGQPLSREEINNLVAASDLHLESAPMGTMIDILYRHRFVGRHEVEKVVTKIAALKFASATQLHSVQETVKFFKNLHIDLWMDIGGGLYSFSELFGYNVRDQKTYNQSFTRDLTLEAKERIFEATGYSSLQKDVRQKIGPDAQVVGSVAFSRNTVLECSAGEIDKARSIRGKVLDLPETPGQVKAEDDHVAGEYAAKHPFTLHSLLGAYSTHAPSQPQKSDAGQQGQLLGLMASMVDHHDTTVLIQRLAPSDNHNYYLSLDGTPMSRSECCEILQKEIVEREALGIPPTPEEQSQIRQLKELQEYFQTQEQEYGEKLTTVNIAGTTLGSVSTKSIRREPGLLSSNDRKIVMLKHDDGSISIHAMIGATAVNTVDTAFKAEPGKAGQTTGSMAYGSEVKKPKKPSGKVEIKEEREAPGELAGAKETPKTPPPTNWITAQTAEKSRSVEKPSKTPFLARAIQTVKRFLHRANVWRTKTSEGLINTSEDHEISLAPKEDATESALKGGFAMGGSTVISIYLSRDYHLVDNVKKFIDVGARERKDAPPETIEIQSPMGAPFATPVLYQTSAIIDSLPTKLTGSPLEKLRSFHEQLKDITPPTDLTKKWLSILDQADPPSAADIATIQQRVGGDDRYILDKLLGFFQKSTDENSHLASM